MYYPVYITIFILALLITPFVRAMALRFNITDHASLDPLKIHSTAIPLLGGVAVFISMVTGMILMSRSGTISISQLNWILFAGAIIFTVNLLDDIFTILPGIRLLAQLLAGVLLVFAGMGVQTVPIGWIAILLTLFYIVGSINAFNVTDGMDGLCAGIAIISCAGFFFLGMKSGQILLFTLAGILFMSLLGFLPHNFYPAKIFLGDAGSGFIGFMLGVMAVMATDRPYDIRAFIAPILILGLPIFDMALAVIRRFIRKRPLFAGDRDHIYDLLLKKGWSQPLVWGIMCVGQVVVVGIGVIVAGK